MSVVNNKKLLNARRICSCALDVFGVESQAIVAIEELSELQKELTKYLRGIGDEERIAEEIADVSIMLEQMVMAFDIRAEVAEQRMYKLLRLANRIAKVPGGAECLVEHGVREKSATDPRA